MWGIKKKIGTDSPKKKGKYIKMSVHMCRKTQIGKSHTQKNGNTEK